MNPDDEDAVIAGTAEEKQTIEASRPRDSLSRLGSLPQFSYRGFVDEVGKERRKEEERQRAQARRDRWTTPGQRPLAEPPIMDWDYIFREHVPSDAQYAALFPDDPEKRCTQKDLDGEGVDLYHYSQWLQIMAEDEETEASRREFYRNLELEVQKEYSEVREERDANASSTSLLSQFEYSHLDRDGGTRRLVERIERGADVMRGYGEEVKQKYGHLIPPDFHEDELATFQFQYIDGDGGVDELRRTLLTGETDPFSGWSPMIREKYAYLIPADSKFRRSECSGNVGNEEEQETEGDSQSSSAIKDDEDVSTDGGTAGNNGEPRDSGDGLLGDISLDTT